MMKPLSLSPLPTLRADDISGTFQMEREGFVDDGVIVQMMIGTLPGRSVADPADLALAADDNDFAGWQLTATTFSRTMTAAPETPHSIFRRAAPPVVEEPGLDAPHQGEHRWWLAGLAGVLSTLLFSLLLLSLSSRPGTHFETLLIPRMLTTARPTPDQKPETPNLTPELTDISPNTVRLRFFNRR